MDGRLERDGYELDDVPNELREDVEELLLVCEGHVAQHHGPYPSTDRYEGAASLWT